MFLQKQFIYKYIDKYYIDKYIDKCIDRYIDKWKDTRTGTRLMFKQPIVYQFFYSNKIVGENFS